jgi:hypothetical protein
VRAVGRGSTAGIVAIRSGVSCCRPLVVETSPALGYPKKTALNEVLHGQGGKWLMPSGTISPLHLGQAGNVDLGLC